MVWFNLRVGSYYMKYCSIPIEEKKYPYCDENGDLLTYKKGNFESGYFENSKGERKETPFFLINNKPYAKISKTKETDKYIEVDINEKDDLYEAKEYIIECQKLYEDLINSGKALKFGMSFGGGGKFGSVKTYYAYVYPSPLYKGLLFMSCATNKKSEGIAKVYEGIQQNKKLQELNLTIQGINKIKIEDLITL